VIYYF